MAYMFHEDEHGEVIAESVAEGVQSFLGLHFPATDIPQAARDLFVVNGSRMIVDANSQPVPMAQGARLAQPIVLSKSQLRAVAGCHTQYMKNMGSLGSLTVPLVSKRASPDAPHLAREGKLVGLCVCQHTRARYVPYATRAAAEFLSQIFCLRMSLASDEEERVKQERNSRIQAAICDKMVQNGGSVEAMLATLASSRGFLDIVSASGGAIVYHHHVFLIGQAPNKDDVLELSAWLAAQQDEREAVAHHQSIHEAGFPRAAALKDQVAAVLMVQLQLDERISGAGGRSGPGTGSGSGAGSGADSGAVPEGGGVVKLLWFRPEAPLEMKWAGSKTQPQGTVLQGGQMHPRTSFDTFIELVSFRAARDWDRRQLLAAQGLALIIADAVRCAEGPAFPTDLLVRVNEERLKSLGSLQEVASELARIVGKAKLPVILLDTEGKIFEWNDMVMTMSGIPRDVAKGSLLADLVHPSCSAAVREAIVSVMNGGEETQLDLVLVTASKLGSDSDDLMNQARGISPCHPVLIRTGEISAWPHSEHMIRAGCRNLYRDARSEQH